MLGAGFAENLTSVHRGTLANADIQKHACQCMSSMNSPGTTRVNNNLPDRLCT